MKKILLVITSLFGMISCNPLMPKGKVHVPEFIIQKQMAKKFPMTQNYILAKAILEAPEISFKEDKIYLDMKYKLSGLGEEEKGRIKMNSNIKYDASTKEIYLENLDITDFMNEHDVKITDEKMSKAIKQIIENYVSTKPVYKYEPEDNKNVNVKNITIENGKLYIEVE